MALRFPIFLLAASALVAMAGCSKSQPDTTSSEPTAPVQAATSSGETLFAKCAACHSLEAGKNLIGPSLHGIIGRKAALAEGYSYSAAMKASGLTWNEAELATYIEKPQKIVPGTRMSFAGLSDPAERSALIAYIAEKSK